MRLLVGPDRGSGELTDEDLTDKDLTDEDLRALYTVPEASWVRCNMISTLDGAATGEDGRSGSINDAADKRVFDLLRELADVVVVGAGTAEAEGYAPAGRPIVVVSRRGRLPSGLDGAAAGQVLLATCEHADGLPQARERLGQENVLVLGGHRVDLVELRARLAARGLHHVLAEGGPHLLRDLLAHGVLDELDATIVPRVVAGTHPRITDGPPIDAGLELRLLLEQNHTLVGRWAVVR